MLTIEVDAQTASYDFFFHHFVGSYRYSKSEIPRSMLGNSHRGIDRLESGRERTANACERFG
ncbi:hypothetical protein, partial [uncultured Alistipes sp.]|uniref:hypothetical protein n=1 Tax=uncultured Alistipes sp. TaxID=538949 RepID=UPI002599586E